MRRDLERLGSTSFDVVVVGGGILGAFVAWDASLRGLEVALLEREDFGSGTTAGCGKVLHGGLRYLRRFDPVLAFEARREQLRVARLAPALVRPLPFLIPAWRGTMRERLVLRGAAAAWAAALRATGLAGGTPPPRWLSAPAAAACDARLGALCARGALELHDIQVRSPERLALAVVRESDTVGAAVANYVEATGLEVEGGRVRAVRARDRWSGSALRIAARSVVNAAGPWAPAVWAGGGGQGRAIGLRKGIHLVVDVPASARALALPWRDAGPAERGGGGGAAVRNLFVMPWEGLTLVGATYAPFEGDPAGARPEPAEVAAFAAEVAERWPALGVGPERVVYAYGGLYPVFESGGGGRTGYDASLHPLVVDHGGAGGPAGLISAVSVKLTTARALAERVVDAVAAGQGRRPGPSLTAESPALRHARLLPVDERGDGDGGVVDRAVLEASVVAAVEQEMACTLADVAFRRTHLGHRGRPDRPVLDAAGRAMAARLGWSAVRLAAEIDAVEEVFAMAPAGGRAGA